MMVMHPWKMWNPTRKTTYSKSSDSTQVNYPSPHNPHIYFETFF